MNWLPWRRREAARQERFRCFREASVAGRLRIAARDGALCWEVDQAVRDYLDSEPIMRTRTAREAALIVHGYTLCRMGYWQEARSMLDLVMQSEEEAGA